jgi:hypothetical protein
MSYTVPGENHLPKQSHGCQVVVSPTTPPSQVTLDETPPPRSSYHLRRALVSAAHGLPLTLPAEQCSALPKRGLPISVNFAAPVSGSTSPRGLRVALRQREGSHPHPGAAMTDAQ